MKPFRPARSGILAGLIFFLLPAVVLSGADTWSAPTATTAQEGAFEVNTVSRVNGCRFVLKRYTKGDPALMGNWTQEVYLLERRVIALSRQSPPGVKCFKIECDGVHSIVQADHNGDGIYETFLIYSASDNKMMEVLVLTPSGWLRHATKAEFTAEESFFEQLRRPVQPVNREDDKAIRKTWNDMKGALTNPK